MNEVIRVDALSQAIAKAETPEEVLEIDAKLAAAEEFAKKSWLLTQEELRPINEARVRARWKLGQLLAEQERKKAPGKGKMVSGGFTSFLGKLGISRQAAVGIQRIGTLPDKELERVLADNRGREILTTYEDLERIARPYWFKESRAAKHSQIARQAQAAKETIVETNGNGESHLGQAMGPFALIYADPPWKFEVYSEKGMHYTADQHYPTLSDDEIIGHLIQGKTVPEVTHDKAALFLWATSSNLPRALRVMECWGFEFKTSAVWVKNRLGMGYVFRNRHEVLLYGTRGAMPAPQAVYESVLEFDVREHSAKPREIRQYIETMYPNFDEATRLELFARGSVSGWSVWGNEATNG